MSTIIYTASLTPKQVISSPSVTNPTVVNDVIYSSLSGGLDSCFDLNIVETTDNGIQSNTTIINNTPNLITFDSNRNMNVLASGNINLTINVDGLATNTLSGIVTKGTTGSTKFKRFVDAPNVVSAHIQNAIFNMVNGKVDAYANPGWTINNTQTIATANNNNITTPLVTRNPNLFTTGLNGIDLSGISVLRSSNGTVIQNSGYPFTLIYANLATTTDYIAFTGHVGATVGDTVIFSDYNNNYYIGTVTVVTYVPSSYGDNYLVKLSFQSNNLPTTIKPFKLMPSNYANYFPTVGTPKKYFDFPVLFRGMGGDKWQFIGGGSNTLGYVGILLANGLGTGFGGNDIMIFGGMRKWSGGPINNACISDPTITKLEYYEPLRNWSWSIVSGDSCSPIFVPIAQSGPGATDYQPVLLHCTNFSYAGYSGGGAFYPAIWSTIQPLLENLVIGSSTAVQMDLSKFYKFSF